MLPDARLTGTAKVTFHIPAKALRSGEVPVIVWQDDAAWRWLPTTVDGARSTATAETDHFSWGFLGAIDVTAWTKASAAEVGRYLTGRSGVAQPRCGDEAAVRDAGVTVTSNGGDSVKWCAGHDGTTDVVRIANNRRTFASVTVPLSWRFTGANSLSLSSDAVARTLGAGAESLVAASGTQTRVVSGGDTVTFALPPATGGTALVQLSFFSWAVSALQLGASVYTEVARVANAALGAASAATFPKIIAKLSGADPSDGWGEALRSCERALRDHLGEVPNAPTAGADLGNVAKFVWGCLPGVMSADVRDSGVALLALGAVLSIVGFVVSTVLTAVNLVVTAARETYDSLASFGGRSNPVYQIVLHPAPPRLDIRNVRLPAGVCRPDAPSVQLHDGVGANRSAAVTRDYGSPDFELYITDPPSLVEADLTGDGNEDVAVVVTCRGYGAGNMRFDHVVVVTAGTDGALKLLGDLEPDSHGSGVGSAHVTLHGGKLRTLDDVFRDGDPNCCATGHGFTEWSWNGTAFVESASG